jgi:hypothetical protein
MEFIKKTILQAVTTGTTTGCTSCYVIIPNTGATYYFKIGLIQEAYDWGFFDAYTINSPFFYIQLSGATTGITEQNINIFKSVLSGGTTLAESGLGTGYSTGIMTGSTIPTIISNATGATSNSRLSELKKYAVGVPFNQQYFGGGSTTNDGVDFNNSISGVSIIYYIGGIKYIDVFTGSTSGTTFSYTPLGENSPDFINVPYYKDFNKENIISYPEINNDVFINRQQLSAFDSNYKLEYINDLSDLLTYAGGKFFNIVNNT